MTSEQGAGRCSPHARLSIHAGGTPNPFRKRALGLLDKIRQLRRLRSSLPDEPLELLIDDLKGQRMMAIHNAGQLTVVPLPAGTYHITVIKGRIQRGYTLMLKVGTCVDLRLSLAGREGSQ